MAVPRPALPWHARLDLRFAPRPGGGTVLAERRHVGPLQVQKALYPEGSGICHVAVLHPPGGIAAGDRLHIGCGAAGDAHAVLTTPGATKWYRSEGAPAEQRLTFQVAGAATLEWLPRENIFFDASIAALGLDVNLSAGARFLGWEIHCFGRRAAGERWRRGRLSLDARVRRDGRSLFAERAEIAADGGFPASPVGLAGCSVSATLLAAGFEPETALLERCRAIGMPDTRAGAGTAAPAGRAHHGLTWLPGVLVGRYLGDSSEQAFSWFTALWSVLRPALLGRAPQRPRLWAC